MKLKLSLFPTLFNVVLCTVSMKLKTVFEYALWLAETSVFKCVVKWFNQVQSIRIAWDNYVNTSLAVKRCRID